MADEYRYRNVDSTRMLFVMMIGVFLICSLVVTAGSVGALVGSPLPDETRDTLSFVYNGVFYACGLAFLWWLMNFAENCRVLGIRGMRYTPIKAVLWWFIPILNLVVPYRIMQELWRATKPELPVAEDWDNRPGSRLIMAWWAVYVIGGVFALFAVTQKDQQNPAYLWLDVTVGVGDIAAAGFVMAVVIALTKRQNEFARMQGIREEG